MIRLALPGPFPSSGRSASLLLALLALVAASSAQAQISRNGQLQSSFYTFNRPETATTFSGQIVHFDAIPVTISSFGSISASITSSSVSMRVYIYQNNFDPFSDLMFPIAAGGTSTTTPNAMAAFATHWVVVAAVSPGATGTYSVSINGPGIAFGNSYPNNLSSQAILPTSGTASILQGQSATLGVFFSGPQPHTFQWYYGTRPPTSQPINPSLAIPGATSFRYNTGPLSQTTNFWCHVTNSYTNRRSGTLEVQVASVPANFTGELTACDDTWNRMTVINVPSGQICHYEVITLQIPSPGTYTISVTSAQFAPSINLYINKFFPLTPAVNWVDTGAVRSTPGTLNYTLTLPDGTYEIVVSTFGSAQVGAYSGSISGPSVALIQPPPTTPSILTQPLSQTVGINTAATLSFAVESACPRTIQWYRGQSGDTSMPISSANATSYTTPILAATGDFSYWARVSNTFGSADTESAVIRVVDQPITFNSTLRVGNRRWNRPAQPSGVHGNPTYYKVWAFRPTTLGTYTFTVTSPFPAELFLYNQIFSPTSPRINLSAIATSGSLTFTFVDTTTKFLVITSSDSNGTGAFSGAVSGPGYVTELPYPVIAQHPLPSDQLLWPIDDPAELEVLTPTPNTQFEWFPGTAPGVPFDGATAIAGAFSNRYDPPAASISRWFYARLSNPFGYDDSELAAVRIRPAPSWTRQPLDTTTVYGASLQLSATATNIPFSFRWFAGNAPSTASPLQTNLIQSFSTNYILSASTTLTLPTLNAGSYSYWVRSANPTGTNNSRTAAVTVTQRPLNVALQVTNRPYSGLPSVASAAATDPMPGPTLPNPLPIDIRYSLGGTSTPSAVPPVNAGTYLVSATVNHQNFQGAAATNLTLSQAPLIAAALPQSMNYGGPLPSLTLSYTGFVNGESAASLDVPPTTATPATIASPAGAYPIQVNGGSDNNYAFTRLPSSLTVHPAPLTVRPLDVQRAYGQTNPPLQLAYAGFVNGESPDFLTAAPVAETDASPASPVGPYPIRLLGGSATNYVLNLTNGTLTVTQAVLVATADDATRFFGQTNPIFTITYTGFVNADSVAQLDLLPTPSTPATLSSLPGTYPIQLTGGSDANYAFDLRPGTLTVLNNSPAISQGASISVTLSEDNAPVPFDLTLAASDPENESLTWFLALAPTQGVATVTSAVPSPAVSYLPSPDVFGSDLFRVGVYDPRGATSFIEVALTIQPVNDPPSFQRGPDLSVAEDSGASLFPTWATLLSPGPSNEAAQSLTFVVTNSLPALFAAQPRVSSAGDLSFEPAPNAFGQATVSLTLTDNGGGASNSAPQTFRLSITNLPDPPQFAGPTLIRIPEDGSTNLVILAGDPDFELTSVALVNPDTNLALATVDPSGSSTNATRTLTVAGTTNAFGSNALLVVVSDALVDITNVVALDIHPVNDPPSFALLATQFIHSGGVFVAPIATTIRPGPSNESHQRVTFLAAAAPSNLFRAQPTVTTNGVLTFESNPSVAGEATLSLALRDDGGTNQLGTDLSASQHVRITLIPASSTGSGTTAGATTAGASTAGATTSGTTGSDTTAGVATAGSTTGSDSTAGSTTSSGSTSAGSTSGSGTGSVTGGGTGSSGPPPGDFDGDGTSDLVWRQRSTFGFYYFNITNGITDSGPLLELERGSRFVGAAELSGDGRLDFLVQRRRSVQAIVFSPTNAPATVDLFAVPAGWRARGTAELDGSGSRDVFIQRGRAVQGVLLNGLVEMDRIRLRRSFPTLGSGPYDGSNGEDWFKGRGRQVRVRLRDASGDFPPPWIRVWKLDPGQKAVALGRFGGDTNRVDLIIEHRASGQVSVARHTGVEFAAGPIILTNPPATRVVGPR